ELEIQLHTKLEDAHRLPQAADLAHAGAVRDQRIQTQETERVRYSELRRVKSVERLGPELEPASFTQRGHFPVFAKREVEGMQSRRNQRVRSGVAVVAQFRMCRDIAVGTTERRGIVPSLAGGRAAQASVADAIRIGGGARI